MELGDEFEWEPYDPRKEGHEAPRGEVRDCPGFDEGDDSDLPPEITRGLIVDGLEGEGP